MNIGEWVTLLTWVVIFYIIINLHFNKIEKQEEEINENLKKIINILNKRKR